MAKTTPAERESRRLLGFPAIDSLGNDVVAAITNALTTDVVSDNGLLRGILYTIAVMRDEQNERLDLILAELKAQTIQQNDAYQLDDDPDAYREAVQ